MSESKVNVDELFGELWADEEFQFQVKAQDVATNLARALAESGRSRASLAEALGWKPSRVTKVLSGESNLTLRTVYEVARAIGLDFDVVFRSRNAARATQPWDEGYLLDDAGRLLQQAERNVAKTNAMLNTIAHLSQRAWRENANRLTNMVGSAKSVDFTEYVSK